MSGEIWLIRGGPVLIEPDFSQVRDDTFYLTPEKMFMHDFPNPTEIPMDPSS